MAYFWHVAVNCYFLPLRLILLCSGFWHGWATHKKFDVLFHYGDEGKSLSYKVYGYKNEPKPRLPGKQKRYSTLSGYDWWDEAIFPFRRERTIGTLKFLSSNFWAQLWLMPFRFLWAWRISLFKASASSSVFPHSFHQRSSWLTKPPLGWMWGVGHGIFLWCCIEPWKVFSKSVGCKISDESMQYNNADMWWGRLWIGREGTSLCRWIDCLSGIENLLFVISWFLHHISTVEALCVSALSGWSLER